jgi:hypothetical protein
MGGNSIVDRGLRGFHGWAKGSPFHPYYQRNPRSILRGDDEAEDVQVVVEDAFGPPTAHMFGWERQSEIQKHAIMWD